MITISPWHMASMTQTCWRKNLMSWCTFLPLGCLTVIVVVLDLRLSLGVSMNKFRHLICCKRQLSKNSWQFLTHLVDPWWFLISPDNLLMIHDNYWLFTMIHKSSWQFMIIHDNSWPLLTVHANSWLFMASCENSGYFRSNYLQPLTSCENSEHFMKIHDSSWKFMAVHESWLCCILVHFGSQQPSNLHCTVITLHKSTYKFRTLSHTQEEKT